MEYVCILNNPYNAYTNVSSKKDNLDSGAKYQCFILALCTLSD